MKECLANRSVNEWLCQAVETRLLREAGGWEQGIRTQGWKASQVNSEPGRHLFRLQDDTRTVAIFTHNVSRKREEWAHVCIGGIKKTDS
jgi:hypothetical protein